MADGVGPSAGNAGMRPATLTLTPSACLEVPLQAGGSKSAPLARRGVCDGGGAGGSGAYVHTPKGTSPWEIFEGRTVDALENIRKRKRFKSIVNCASALVRGGEEEAGRALFSCGRYFRRGNSPCGTVKLKPCYCDSVFCPECARRRSKPLQEKIFKRLNQTKYDYFFLTVTVRNWFLLTNEALKKFTADFAKLRETEVWLEQVFGGYYSVETTYNRTESSWHPHLHVLIETRKRVPMDWIDRVRDSWRGITGSHYLRLEPLYGVDKKGHKKRKINKAAIRELVKYATKSHDFSDQPARVIEFFNAFKSIRRIQGFGSFLGAVKEADAESEQESDPKPNDLVGCSCGMCRWRDVVWSPELIHVSQTVLAFDGTRQLRLFDSGSDPPVVNALDLVNILKDAHNDSAIALGTLPRTLPLLDVAPLAF